MMQLDKKALVAILSLLAMLLFKLTGIQIGSETIDAIAYVVLSLISLIGILADPKKRQS